MREVEVKILEVDVARTVAKLERLGASKAFEGEIRGISFDFADRRLSKAGMLLRLRRKGGEVELALKKLMSRKGAKDSEETEIYVSDFEKCGKILKGAGLQERDIVGKRRVSYSVGKAHFEFDTIPGLPTYLEIEAESKEQTLGWVRKLGFPASVARPWSTRNVLRYYGKA